MGGWPSLPGHQLSTVLKQFPLVVIETEDPFCGRDGGLKWKALLRTRSPLVVIETEALKWKALLRMHSPLVVLETEALKWKALLRTHSAFQN